MLTDFMIRVLQKTERLDALTLVWNVFQEYEAPDYSEEGIEEFHKSIHDKAYLSDLCFYGAFIKEQLVGVLATRSGGAHIALFFVDGAYQGQGIGRQLFEAVRIKCPAPNMTVNSSPYAVPIYHHLGFADTDVEQSVHGLRFTPMEVRIEK